MSWRDNQSDPNSPVAQATRRQALCQARAPRLLDDRAGYLASQAAGKRVLDVGIVAHTADAYQSEQWLHRRIREKAAYCLGCDILEPEVAHLRDLGFNVVCHDITTTPLPEKFDLIVLGELIEHIGRPGDLLANCAQMLAPGGRVILSTPNPWFITYALKGLFGRAPLVDSVDHVGWFEPATLFELGDRAGLHLERYTGVRVAGNSTLKARLLFAGFFTIGRLFLRREALAMTIIYEFRKRF